MRGFEEIQKIVENFVEESKQAKQQIIEIENERNNLAQERNEKKEANIQENLAKINELGKQISKLGNQSQELQNKLDKRFFEVKELVNLMIDNKITEEMRKIRKINEVKDGLELRYQLLTGVYGTLLEAENNKKSKALFLVIVFTDGITREDENAVNRNNDDFKNFCQQIVLSAEGGTICKSNVALTIKKVEISLKSEI